MPVTGWPIEARLELIKDVILALRNADAAKSDGMNLISKILADEGSIGVTPSHSLYQTLKKSNCWNLVRLFLTRNSNICGRKGCKHAKYKHHNVGCNGTTYKHLSGTTGAGHTVTYHHTPCSCPGYVQQTF